MITRLEGAAQEPNTSICSHRGSASRLSRLFSMPRTQQELKPPYLCVWVSGMPLLSSHNPLSRQQRCYLLYTPISVRYHRAVCHNKDPQLRWLFSWPSNLSFSPLVRTYTSSLRGMLERHGVFLCVCNCTTATVLWQVRLKTGWNDLFVARGTTPMFSWLKKSERVLRTLFLKCVCLCVCVCGGGGAGGLSCTVTRNDESWELFLFSLKKKKFMFMSFSASNTYFSLPHAKHVFVSVSENRNNRYSDGNLFRHYPDGNLFRHVSVYSYLNMCW